MLTYVIGRWDGPPPANADFPCFTLNQDRWNDYGWKTLFHLIYWPKPYHPTEVGDVKILQENPSDSILDPEGKIADATRLPAFFDTLGPEYASLGQEVAYYERLRDLGDLGLVILSALRDVVYDVSARDRFATTEPFQKSLLRNSEAVHNFEKAGALFARARVTTGRVKKFTFTHQVEGFGVPHRVECDFTEIGSIPYRTMAFIGKNGTGKTAVMAELAWQISGMAEQRTGFDGARPEFSRLIVVSYSPFGPFRFPERAFSSYRYCGFNMGGLGPDVTLYQRILSAVEAIRESERVEQWKLALRDAGLLQNEPLLTTFDLAEPTASLPDVIRNLSSGHFIAFSFLTEIVAHLLSDSLLLMDEPELYLHPNLVSGVMRALETLLGVNSFNSYAIVATHSPIVVQEIPSRSVRVFSREDNEPHCITPGFECFGENLTTIVNQIFGATRVDKNYMQILNELSVGRSAEQIDSLFGGKLGMNAMAYLNSLESERRGLK